MATPVIVLFFHKIIMKHLIQMIIIWYFIKHNRISCYYCNFEISLKLPKLKQLKYAQMRTRGYYGQVLFCRESFMENFCQSLATHMFIYN